MQEIGKRLPINEISNHIDALFTPNYHRTRFPQTDQMWALNSAERCDFASGPLGMTSRKVNFHRHQTLPILSPSNQYKALSTGG